MATACFQLFWELLLSEPCLGEHASTAKDGDCLEKAGNLWFLRAQYCINAFSVESQQSEML